MTDVGALRQPRPGRLETAVLELGRIERSAAFRRRHRDHARLRLRHSDELLRLVEECRVRGFRLVAPGLWTEVVRFIGAVDTQLRDDLGIDRRPDHVAEVLFMAQAQLMQAALTERIEGLAQIIPLFGTAS